MKHFVVANWKMNPSAKKEAVELFETIKKNAKGIKNVEVVICPPFVYLSSLSVGKGKLHLGAQNVFYKEKGAYTGEVSPSQLRDLKVKYVIIGHSEARKYLEETDEAINKKIKESLREGLKPIVCVGEEKNKNKSEILKKQITEDLKGVSTKDFKNIVIAYEPVWAVGTGKNCQAKETKKAIELIRNNIAKLWGKKASEQAKIIYGGSVNPKNSFSYIKESKTNGLMVGKNSLNARDFIKIIKSVAKE